jgi:uncharacterized membrane protein YidH (DUF202 family)
MDRRTYLQIRGMTNKFTPDLLRTFLANERTFLAFIRTSLTMLIVAITIIKFIDNRLIDVIGWIFVVTSISTFFVGLTRYLRTKILIRAFHSGDSEASGHEKRDTIVNNAGDLE